MIDGRISNQHTRDNQRTIMLVTLMRESRFLLSAFALGEPTPARRNVRPRGRGFCGSLRRCRWSDTLRS